MAFATESDVRLRKGYYRAEEVLGANIEDEIQLDHRAYNIILIIKNGDDANPLVDSGTTPPVAGEFQFIKPRKIILGDFPASSDIFDVLYGTDILTSVITIFIAQATNTIKVTLKRFGDVRLAEWDTATPPRVQELAADLAGNLLERSIISKTKKVPPEQLGANRSEYNRIIKELDRIESEQDNLPGEKSIGRPLIARTEPKVFADEKNWSRTDHAQLERRLGLDGRDITP